jgi:hypothetical protein
LPKPGDPVVRVEVDAELLFDEQAEPRRRPDLGGETMIGRFVSQPPQRDFLLGGGKFGRTARDGSCRQPGSTMTVEGSHPAADTAGSDAEEVGDLLGSVSLRDALDGETPPTLQFSG